MKQTSSVERILPSLFAAILFSFVAALIFPIFANAQTEPNPATSYAGRLGESWWADRHKAVLESVKSHQDTELLLIGDSITNNYGKANPPDENFQPTWKQFRSEALGV